MKYSEPLLYTGRGLTRSRSPELRWNDEKQLAMQALGVKSRYARSWKWKPGQNGPVVKRQLSPQELEALHQI